MAVRITGLFKVLIKVGNRLTTVWRATGYIFQFSEAAEFLVGQEADCCLQRLQRIAVKDNYRGCVHSRK